MSGLNHPETRTQVAVIGYAARLPEASSAEDAWAIMAREQSVISRIQPDRWAADRFLHPVPGTPGATYTDACGQLRNLWDFDPAAFGISPREAMQMDPQHRLLLEVTAEAIDAAGLDPDRWDKPRTGVFIGAASSDHSNHFIGNFDAIDAQFMLGNTLSIMSNRLAYQFDAHGPSFTVDTACSSSFYALHNAVQAIRNDEIDTAIVGAVNVLLSPLPFIGFSQAAMLAPDGRCKPFDAAANGYVRSEGAVVFILRRGDLARAGGDCVRSIVEAAEINSDGRTIGMALPSEARQTALLEQVLERNAIDPNDLAFIEAHGTGTAVGDPVEAAAIGHAIGQKRRDPICVGSAKSNFGHLEPASGLVGLLKAQMALEKGIYPATINHDTPNPNIDFAGLNIAVADTAQTLPERERPWAAGINSFGFGGANSHVVLRQLRGDDRAPEKLPQPAPGALILSAASKDALAALVGRWAATLDTATPAEAARMINSANHRARRQACRMVLSGQGIAGITRTLAAADAGDPSGRFVQARATGTGRGIGFVFSGNGAQWAGMARHEISHNPVFRECLLDVANIVAGQSDIDVLELLHSPDLDAALDRSELAQPLLFAVQVALVGALDDAGLRPDAVIGHSLGEVAAAWCAGALSLGDAAHLVISRARALEALAGQGGMAAVMAGAETLETALADFGDQGITISADNSPRSSTISGPVAALDAFAKFARKRRLAVKRLPLDYPYHSAHVDQIRDRLMADLAGLKCQAGTRPFFSSTRGRAVAGLRLDADYWWDNARAPVQFRSAVTEMIGADIGTFVEIGPRPVMRSYLVDTAEAAGASISVLHTLGTGREETRSVDDVFAEALATGVDLDEAGLIGAPDNFAGQLPAYPWDHAPFRAPHTDLTIDAIGSQPGHPLLGSRLRAADPVWISRIDAAKLPWLADHRIQDQVLLPATAMIDMMVTAGRAALDVPAIELRDFEIVAPVLCKPGIPLSLRTIHDAGAGQIRISYRAATEGGAWHPVAQATIRAEAADAPPGPGPMAGRARDAAEIYPALALRGLCYGPSFGLLHKAVTAGAEARIKLTESDQPAAGFSLHPMLADAVLHGIVPLLEDIPGVDDTASYVPIRADRLRVFRPGATPVSAHVRRRFASDLGADFDITYLDAENAVIAAITGLSLTARPPGNPAQSGIFWAEQPRKTADAGFAGRLAAALARHWLDKMPEPGDGALLLDALAQRTAWEIASDPALRDAPIAARAEDILIAAGITTTDPGAAGCALPEECPWPAPGTLSVALAQIAPDWAPLLPAALGLGRHCRGADGAAPKIRIAADPRRVAIWARIGDVIRDAAKDGPATICIIGDPPRSMIEMLCAAAHLDLIITHPDNACRDAIATRLAGLDHVVILPVDDLAGLGPVDAAFLVDLVPRSALLAALSAPKPVPVVAIAPCPTVFDDLHAAGTGAAQVQPSDLRSGLVRLGCAEVLSGFLDVPGLSVAAISGILPANPAEGHFPARLTGDGALVAALGEMPLAEPDTVIHITGDQDLCDAMGEIQQIMADPPAAVILAHPLSGPGAGIAGLARVLRNEYPAMPLRTLGYDPALPPAEIAEGLRQACLAPAAHARVAPRDTMPAQAALRAITEPALRLIQPQRGALQKLHFTPVSRRAPGPEEVEIAVAATGLNFRDVMWAQGLLPREALEAGFAGPTLGMEISGHVIRAGAAAGFAPGDPVIALTPDGFSSHVTVTCRTVMPMPKDADPVLAAALPTIFMTAHYALAHAARLGPGETVLIHGGAGGVGLAAIQVARARGATVMATAGTAEKRDFLRALGLTHVFDSRSTGFADDVMAATGGTGVDVVLNALAGVFQQVSLECLRPFGRFLEIGKRDFFENSRLALRPFRNNLTFIGIDMDQILAARPDIAETLATEVSAQFEDGTFHIPPVTVFEASAVIDAFRLMQRAGHMGKIVVKAPQLPMPVAAPVPDIAGGAWLITGGTSGFGYEAAEWLIAKGVRELWLISRSGDLPDLARRDLERRGITAHIRAVDVADAGAMADLFAEIDRSATPLWGVIHAAMVLQDGLFADQSMDDWRDCIAAKVTGALHLDQMSRGRDLAHFMMFSSVTTLFGNPGQAGYVTANAALNALAHARRAAGLPATAIAWGPIGDAGVLARNGEQRALLARQLGDGGVMTAETALGHLDTYLASGARDPVIAIAPMNWGRLAADLPLLSSPLFAGIDLAQPGGPADDAHSLAARIAGLETPAAIRKITELLIAETAEILRQPGSEIDPHMPLTDMGFDSLMAVNLRLSTEEKFDIRLPLLALADGMTLAQLARRLFDGLAIENADRALEAAVGSHVGQSTEIDAVVLEKVRQRATSVRTLKETING